MTTIFIMLGGLVYLPLVAILHGWVLTVMWRWFVSPVFGVPELGLAVAIGFAMTISFLTQSVPEYADNDTAAVTTRLLTNGIARPVFMLLVGWLVVQFV